MKKKTIPGGRFRQIILSLAAILILLLCLDTSVFAYCSRSGNFNRSYRLTGNGATDIVGVAKKQLNRTKANLGYTEAWCADFVMDCAQTAGIPASVIPWGSRYSGCAECGCFYRTLTNQCRAKVYYNQSEAKAGDLVFYKYSDRNYYPHVGIYAGGGSFIEGNFNGKVSQYSGYYSDGVRTTNNGIKRIYVRPNYGDLSNASVTPAKTSYTYNALPQMAKITVKMNGSTLKEGTDYTLSYTGCTNAGKVTVTVRGKGRYYGTKTASYTIRPCDISSLGLSCGTNYRYNNKAVQPSVSAGKGSWLVRTNFKLNSGYTVSYANNKAPGNASVTIKGRGNYTGTKTLGFKIILGYPANLNLKTNGRTITSTWNGVPGASGYEVNWRKKNGSWNSFDTGVMGTGYSIRNLSRLTTYDVRVRAYRKTNVKKLYGDWSETRTASTGLF